MVFLNIDLEMPILRLTSKWILVMNATQRKYRFIEEILSNRKRYLSYINKNFKCVYNN